MEHFDSDWHRRFRRGLRAWYRRHGRELPWRATTDPYRIWISEIMLQQTTVATVVPYFERFLKRFPTIQTLAKATEEDVLRHWEGLGYYSRARNIHKAAQVIAEEGGPFPRTVETLTRLPGIGRYTAGAIVSFAFDQPAPIVEANTQRLYTRLLGFRDNPKSAAGQRLLWQFAETIVPRRLPGRFNQALMELGSVVCLPQAPKCDRCPVRRCCRAFQEGLQNEIPLPATRPEITALTEISVAVRNDQGEYLLRRCAPNERWAGLWDFIRFSAETNELSDGQVDSRRMCRAVADQVTTLTGLSVQIDTLLTSMRHSVTRYRILLHCFHATATHSATVALPKDTRWIRPANFERYPLSTTGRKLAKHVQMRAK